MDMSKEGSTYTNTMVYAGGFRFNNLSSNNFNTGFNLVSFKTYYTQSNTTTELS